MYQVTVILPVCLGHRDKDKWIDEKVEWVNKAIELPFLPFQGMEIRDGSFVMTVKTVVWVNDRKGVEVFLRPFRCKNTDTGRALFNDFLECLLREGWSRYQEV